MASLLFSRLAQNTAQRCTPKKLLPVIHNFSCSQQRQMTHYPIDDITSGLTEEQIQVMCKKSLAFSIYNVVVIILSILIHFSAKKNCLRLLAERTCPQGQ
jgi:hypothetical protein